MAQDLDGRQSCFPACSAVCEWCWRWGMYDCSLLQHPSWTLAESDTALTKCTEQSGFGRSCCRGVLRMQLLPWLMQPQHPLLRIPFRPCCLGVNQCCATRSRIWALVATQIESLAEILELAVADNLLQPNQVILTFTHMANLLAGTCQAPCSQVDLACPDLCATPGTCSDCCSAAVSLILTLYLVSASCARTGSSCRPLNFARCHQHLVIPDFVPCQSPTCSKSSSAPPHT